MLKQPTAYQLQHGKASVLTYLFASELATKLLCQHRILIPQFLCNFPTYP